MKWTDIEGKKIYVGSGRKLDLTNDLSAEVFIYNYDIIEWRINEIQSIFKANQGKEIGFIVDEVHYLKQKKTKRYKAVKKILKDNKKVRFVGISGTPILNRPLEIIGLLQLWNTKVFNEYMFKEYFCKGQVKRFGVKVFTNYDGANNLEKLNNILKKIMMVRRKKIDVLKQLPAKNRQYIYIEECNYVEDRTQLKLQLEEMQNVESVNDLQCKKINAIAELSKLRVEAVKAKYTQALQFIENQLETEKKIVVFCYHKEIIGMLLQDLEKYNAVYISGDVAMNKRQTAVDSFMQDESCRVFVGSIRACGVGLTLTAASTAVFVEFDWTAAGLVQAEDRIHRIGQNESVNIYYLVLNNSIEISISQMIDKKFKIEQGIVDGVEEKERTDIFEDIRRLI